MEKQDSPRRHRDHGVNLEGKFYKFSWLGRSGQLFASIRVHWQFTSHLRKSVSIRG
jgi:hypothetical protein